MLSKLGDYEKTKLEQTGVYVIVNRQNGKIYIGSTSKSFKSRWKLHLNKLFNGNHHSAHLQSAFNKHGESIFTFQILKICPPETCIAVEQAFLDSFGSYNPERGYNVCKTAGSRKGVKQSAESRAAQSSRMLARSPELSLQAKRIHTGAKRSTETKQRMSQAHKGKVKSDEHKERIRQSVLSTHQSQEVRQRISVGNRGKGFSQETRDRISATLRAKYASGELATPKGRKII